VEIMASMNELLAKLQNNMCSLVSYDFRAAVQKGLLNSDLKDYYNACIKWMESIELARQNPSCAIDTTLPSNLLKRYFVQYHFQLTLNAGRNFLLANQLDSFFVYYSATQKEFLENTEKLRSTYVPSLLDVCRNNPGNIELHLKSIEYLMNKSNFEDSYTLILILANSNSIKEENKAIILRNAKSLATFDKQNKKNKTLLQLYEIRCKGKGLPKYYKVEYFKTLF
jgi:hypothetical protein